ncbi:hypothetical protein [Clostridioides sp. ES-S-0108-01]|uniref:hypothetical protein n=1 Tax=Clostridioides sp. ES-S-0108-01 TaxID=2770773 RepID=UPI001D0C1A2F
MGKVRLEIRAKEQDYFDEVVEKVKNCTGGVAIATGCELEFYFNLFKNPELLKKMKEE